MRRLRIGPCLHDGLELRDGAIVLLRVEEYDSGQKAQPCGRHGIEPHRIVDCGNGFFSSARIRKHHSEIGMCLGIVWV